MQALRRRSFTPIRPHVCADHAALGAHCPPVQVHEHGVVRPTVRVDDCAVMAVEPGRAVDQQSPDAMRADMPERHRRPLVLFAVVVWPVGRRGNRAHACGQSSAKSRNRWVVNFDQTRFPVPRYSLARMVTEGIAMFTSAECQAVAEHKLAEAERDPLHSKRLRKAADAWLFLANKLIQAEGGEERIHIHQAC
jgi:hypothetical protein